MEVGVLGVDTVDDYHIGISISVKKLSVGDDESLTQYDVANEPE